MGLEPTTFCMAMRAPVRSRSRPFAQTAWLQRFRSRRPNATEPERTPNLAILATGLRHVSAVGLGRFFAPAASVRRCPTRVGMGLRTDRGSSS
jgi:hypothetical protein